MPDYDLEAARGASSWTSAALDALQEPALAWARGKLPTLGRFRKALDRHISAEEKGFPEGWYEAASAQLLAGALFGSPTFASRFLRDGGRELRPDARELVERSLDESWRFTVFELRENLSGDFHVCLDHDSRETFLLQSPAVSTLSREGCRIFLSLLLDNGSCCQCFGSLHYFRGYQSYDFAAFAEAVEPQLFAARGLSATIGRHPELFLLLSLYAEIPPQVFRGTALVLCADWHAADEMPRVAHPEMLASRTSGHLTQLALSPSEPDAPYYPQHGLLFFDAKKRRVMAHAMGSSRYGELVEAAGPAWGFSPLPRWKAGMTMVVAMRRLLGKNSPGHEYIGRFEDKAKGEEPPELKRINALLAEISKRRNAGVSYSLADLADLHGVDRENARRMEQLLMQTAERSGGRVRQGATLRGFDGFTPPPPETRRRFVRNLADSPLFDLDGSREVSDEMARVAREAVQAGAGGGRRGEIRRMVADARLELSGIPRFIEEEFLHLFKLPDVTILTYTLYLLLRFGTESRQAALYAAEALRVFGQLLPQAPEPGMSERFAETLSRYFSGVLEPLGLVSTRKSGDGLSLESTPLFRRWVKLSRYWE